MNSAQALALLTPDAFKTWLLGMGEVFVGKEHLSRQCPICEFFRAQGIEVMVGNCWDMSSFNVIGQERVEFPDFWQTVAKAIDEGGASEEYPNENEDEYRPWAPSVAKLVEAWVVDYPKYAGEPV